MATEAIEQQRQEIYEIAEAIAPTWERRRAEVEAVMTPVREWMLRELSPRAGRHGARARRGRRRHRLRRGDDRRRAAAA